MRVFRDAWSRGRTILSNEGWGSITVKSFNLLSPLIISNNLSNHLNVVNIKVSCSQVFYTMQLISVKVRRSTTKGLRRGVLRLLQPTVLLQNVTQFSQTLLFIANRRPDALGGKCAALGATLSSRESLCVVWPVTEAVTWIITGVRVSLSDDQHHLITLFWSDRWQRESADSDQLMSDRSTRTNMVHHFTTEEQESMFKKPFTRSRRSEPILSSPSCSIAFLTFSDPLSGLMKKHDVWLYLSA